MFDDSFFSDSKTTELSLTLLISEEFLLAINFTEELPYLAAVAMIAERSLT